MTDELSALLNTPKKKTIKLPNGKKLECVFRKLSIADMGKAGELVNELTSSDSLSTAVANLVTTKQDELCELVAQYCLLKLPGSDAITAEIFKRVPLSTAIEIVAEAVQENADFFTQLSEAESRMMAVLTQADGAQSGRG